MSRRSYSRPSYAWRAITGSLALLGLTTPGLASLDALPTEAPFLWMIEGDTPTFLFGTVHLPDERVLALPGVVEAAFDVSDALYTEIDMSPATMMATVSGMQLPEGTTLHDVLPPALIERSEKYLASRGLSLMLFARFKPTFFAAQLALLDELEALATQQPLDAVLASRSASEGKETRALETIDEQLAVFDAFDDEEAARMLEMTLDYLEELEADDRSPTDELVELYLAGDEEKLADKMYEYFDPDDTFTETFIEVAVVDRNRRMAERIEEWMSKEPERVHFFAVGALHFPMDDGLLARLRARGHEITRLTPADEVRVREMAMVPEGR